MNTHSNNLKSSVIVSVYTDHVALGLILEALKNQTLKNKPCGNFEIIISEDGISNDIQDCVNSFRPSISNIQHLTQEDSGFRKNIALNRAIKASNTDHLIFIDGDCIPHTAFIVAHQSFDHPGIACSGRRLELGEIFSKKLRTKQVSISRLTNLFSYFLNMLPLTLDNAKNIESGIYSKLLQFITKNNEIRIVGCNFSCNKQDLIKINGFNEEYLEAGTGEDSDIDWRLVKSGVTIKKVKFSAIQYHLYHPRSYGISERNIELFNNTKRSNNYICSHGLKHIQDLQHESKIQP